MNLAIIALDTLHAGHMGCYGYHRDTTPFIDQFAKQSVLFEKLFATTIPTPPSFTTLFTGMDSWGHQVVGVRPRHILDENIPMLAEVLQRNGYQTLAVDNMNQWFSRGFDHYQLPQYAHGKEPSYMSHYGFERKDKLFGEKVTSTADALLDKVDKQKPFFFFCHYWDPHQPYSPPAPYHKLYYHGDPLDPRKNSSAHIWAFRPKQQWHAQWMNEQVCDAQFWVDQYDGEINYVDEQVRRLFALMQAKGLWDDTLVVVTSDHGEIMYEHSGTFDHEGLYDCEIHVPFIMRIPGEAHAGQRVAPMVVNIDILPTLLELLNIKPWDMVEGQSLMPLVRGEKEEYYDTIFLAEGNWQCKRGVRTREWKFIRALSDSPLHNWHGDPPRELYYLPDDPNELTNLIHVRPKVAAELERRLDEFMKRMQEKYSRPDPILVQGPSFGELGLIKATELDSDDFVIR